MASATESSPGTGPVSPGGEMSAPSLFRENLHGQLYEAETAVPLREDPSANYQFLAPSTSSAGASRARTSAWPVAVQASLPLAVDCSSTSSDWLRSYSLAGFSWKMSLGSSRATTGGTSPSSSLPWETQGTAWRGECWTRGGSECPSGAGACSLSAVLEPRVPPRFSLSPKACTGILRRAEKRGRTLPAALEGALRTVAECPVPPNS